MTLCALLTGGPYLIATAELLRSIHSSGKETRRRLYWKVDWCAPFSGQPSKTRSSPSTNIPSRSAPVQSPASTAADSNSVLPQQKTASSTDSNDQGTCSSSAEKEEVLEFVGSAFYIGYTPNKGEASNFYLRPIIQSSSKEDRYFHIVTDPDDSLSDCKKQTNADQNASPPGGTSNDSRPGSETQQQDPPGSQNATKSLDTSQVDSDSQNAPAPIESDPQNTPPPIESNSPSTAAGLDQLDELEPQRYVSVVDDKLVAGLNLKHLKKGSVFKLKHLHEDVTQPLSQSQWLPEALRGSQPHILCRQGNTLRSKFIKGRLMSVYINMEKDHEKRLLSHGKHVEGDKKDCEKRLLSYGKHVEGDKRYSYFILEKGHN